MLAQRVASAAVGLPLIFVLIWAGGGWYTAAVCVLVLVASMEFQRARRDGVDAFGFLAAVLATAIVAGAYVGIDWVLWFTVGATIVPLVWVTLRAQPETALPDWQWALSGILYVGLLGAHLVLLRELFNGRDWVYLTVLGTFAVDTGAFFVGKSMGRQKLAPTISPGKTVEGTLAGFAAGFAAVVLLNYFLGTRLQAALIVPLALLLPLAAVTGDLAESILKRGMRIKDASGIIPGHGGLLDRLDSILFTIPVVYYFLIWVVE